MSSITLRRPFKPTAIRLMSFDLISGDGEVLVTWATGTEIDNVGFNILRSSFPNGPFVRVNTVMIPARAISPAGAAYSFADKTAGIGKTYYYQLEDIDNRGVKTVHNTVSATPIFTGSPLHPVQREAFKAPLSTTSSSTPSKPTLFYRILKDGGNTIEVARLEPSGQDKALDKGESSERAISFSAISADHQIILQWTSFDSQDRFNILRSETEEGEYVQSNGLVISTPEEILETVKYTYTDAQVVPDITYYYKLERIGTEGKSTIIGPIPARPMTEVKRATPSELEELVVK